MPRKARVEFPGAVYDLLDRGDRQEAIFCDASSDPHTARGQLQSTSWSGESYVNYTYLADGKVDHEEYANGMRSDLAYDGRGFISLIRTYRQSSPQQTYSRRDYWRDERDRITAWQKGIDDSANPMENGRGDRYEYDEEGQLWKASYQAEDPSGNATHALRADLFYYDELGSRVEWNTVASLGAVHFSRRNNGLNQYSAWENGSPNHWGSGIYHDDNMPTPSPAPSPPWAWVAPGNGVTMQDGYITASFNALNQPVAMWSPALGAATFMWFGYDPLGRCVKRWTGTAWANAPDTTPATFFYYDGWNLVQEGPNAVAVDRTYVHGNRVDEIVASRVSGTWYYHHYDARGHCIMLTNAIGSLQEQYDYDAFGYPRFYTAGGMKLGTPHTRFLFTGREWLSDLRIYDFRARQYQPELGRFLQPDPKEFAAGDYNLYRYCHNDPINHTDPFGLIEEESPERIEEEIEPSEEERIDRELNRCLHEPTAEETERNRLDAEAARNAFERIKADQVARKVEENSADLPPGEIIRNLPGYVGAGRFANDGRDNSEILPTHDSTGNPIRYQEHDVNPGSRGGDRDSQRLVFGSDGSIWWTSNHYNVGTFERLR